MIRRSSRLASAVALALLLALGVGSAPWLAPPAALAWAQLGRALGQDARADASYAAIERRTAELRGLTPRADVERHFLSPDELRAQVTDDLNDPESRESLEHGRRLMVALGLLAPDVDLYNMELQFRSSVVLGQYDPDTKQLDVVAGGDPTSPLARTTLAHEFTHALQDQYYDIRALTPKHSDNSDRDLAISALLEGDAIIMQELYALHALSRAEREQARREESAQGGDFDLDSLPLVLVEETYFPYTEGPRFIAEVIGTDAMRQVVQTGNGYGPLVNRIFENPPQSTAQILHPEKYRAGIAPITVSLPDLAAALGAGWQELEQDVLGEIDHRVLIQQFLSRERGEAAAAGWAGDRYALLGSGDQVTVVVSSRWDTPAAAQQWAAAYGDAVKARYGASLRVVDQRPDGTTWQTPDGAHALSLAGTSTAIVIAPTADQVARLQQALRVAAPAGVGGAAPIP
jgi:hypothetical protein